MKKVVIIQRIVPHYRVPFFLMLVDDLAAADVELKVVYGQELAGTVPKTVHINRPWAVRIENKYWTILGKEALWQPCLKELADADLVIVEQANRLLINYLLLAHKKMKRYKLAFWGHGQNFQSEHKAGFLEFWKRKFINKVDWWFAYTSLSEKRVVSAGYPGEQVTNVQNAIDTKGMLLRKASVLEVDVVSLKKVLGIDSDNIAIYCGGMYSEKHIPFLLNACALIKEKIPDFHMLFIGCGPDYFKVKQVSDDFSWIHDLGVITSDDRVPYFVMSKLLLMPGLVGLVMLDSFALETPIITTDIPIHSPEIAYLNDGVNGLMSSDDEKKYSDLVVATLFSKEKMDVLKAGCRVSAEQYTLGCMVENFSGGIICCLEGNA